MPRSIVIFDLNGTLIDSMPGLVDDAVGVLHDDYGVDESTSRPVIEAAIASPTAAFFDEAARLAGASAREPVLQAINERFIRRPAVPFPETVDVLRSLSERGYTLFLSATMQPDALAKRLEEADIGKYFRLTLGSNPERGQLKGAEHFEITARELGMSLEDFARAAVSIGDSASDMKLAHDAGIVAIGRLTGNNADLLRASGADYVVRELRELEPLLETID